MSVKLNIALCGGMPEQGYSGGRYHAWIMAESLAAAGHSVTVFTNTKPGFSSDFEALPSHGTITISAGALSVPFSTADAAFDIVVLVPDQHSGLDYYLNAVCLARDSGAQLVLLNFESPNWFNALSPVTRPEGLWRGWFMASAYASVVLSSTAEGSHFAQRYYDQAPADCVFTHAWPAINDAALAQSQPAPKKPQVLLFLRGAADAHKGGQQCARLFSPALQGHTLILVCARALAEQVVADLQDKAAAYGITLCPVHDVSDVEKFQLIRQSRAVVFPSFFEGFGYPPVEALLSGTRCVAFDLPVLREVSGDAVDLVPVGDWNALRDRLAAILGEPDRPPIGPENLAARVSMDGFARRLTKIFCDRLATPRPVALDTLHGVPLIAAIRSLRAPGGGGGELRARVKLTADMPTDSPKQVGVKPKVLGVILARGGTQWVPGVNLRPLAGRPLIEWTIQAGLGAQSIDRLIVSTNDDDIIDVARACGCDVPFKRPAQLATDTSDSMSVVRHALGEVTGYDFVVLLQPTSPLRTAEDIDKAVAIAMTSPKGTTFSAHLVDKSAFLMFRQSAEGRRIDVPVQSGVAGRRQDLPPLHAQNGAIYVAATDHILGGGGFMTDGTIPYIIDRDRAVDVGDAANWSIAEALLTSRLAKQADLSQRQRPEVAPAPVSRSAVDLKGQTHLAPAMAASLARHSLQRQRQGIDFGLITAQLREGFAVRRHTPNQAAFDAYLDKVDYAVNFPAYVQEFGTGDVFIGKALEHWMSLDFIDLKDGAVVMDVAACHSPFVDIVARLYPQVQCYMQDQVYKPGVHGLKIGSDATCIPLPDGSVDSIVAHNSWEHFEGNADIRFISEAARLLRPGGKLTIIPLFLKEKCEIWTSPAVWETKYHTQQGMPPFDPRGEIVVREDVKQRQAKFHSPWTLKDDLSFITDLTFEIIAYDDMGRGPCQPRWALIGQKKVPN